MSGLDYFLADKKFINNLMRYSRRGLSLRTKVVSPRELIQELGITTLDPMPTF